MVGQRDLAGLRTAAAADQRRAGGTVVGLPEGPRRPVAERQAAGDGLYGGHFQGFGVGQRGQQARQTAGQQGFAGAGRPAQQQVVLARRGDNQRPLGGQL